METLYEPSARKFMEILYALESKPLIGKTMDYNQAQEVTNGKEGKTCRISTNNPPPYEGGARYEGVFRELVNDSIILDTEIRLSLKQIEKILFI